MNQFETQYSELCKYLAKFKDIDNIQIKYRLQKAMYYMIENEFSLPPHTINLGVNNKCNFKCKMCDFGQENKDTFYYKFNIGEKKGTQELSLDRCKKLIDEVEWFRPIIRVDYLEPTLWKPLKEFFQYTKNKNLPFWLLSNGYTMKDDDIAFYVNNGLDLIRLSLNGTEDIHNEICGVKNAFGKVIHVLKEFIKQKNNRATPDIGVYFTLQDSNYEYIYDTIKYLHDEGILQHIFVNFQWLLYATKDQAKRHNEMFRDCDSIGNVDEQCLSGVDLAKISVDKIYAQVKNIQNEFKDARINFRPTFDKQILKKYFKGEKVIEGDAKCYIPWYSCSIAPSGDMNFFQHCFMKPLGNINDNSFMDLWNGSEAKKQRTLLKEHNSFPGCERCWGVYNLLDQKRRYAH